MKKTDDMPVIVCRWNGLRDRFFGKYRDDAELDAKKRWKKVPGGPFGPEFDTEKKALACARKWYEVEMAARARSCDALGTSRRSWPNVCDLFKVEAKARVRGADSTRDEAIKRATFLRPSAVLCAVPVSEHDDALALMWLRAILAEPKKKTGSEDEPRDPLTVRNIARVMREIYKFAQAKGYFPRERRLPTDSEEFKAEISGALKEKAKLGKLGRIACPMETVRAVVNNDGLSDLRRMMTRTATYTGVRPGELHAWRISDYRDEFGVKILDVREQWTLARKDYPSRLAPLKTIHAKRKIPVHASLEARLDGWIETGWKRHVGRAPNGDDFLFPNESGAAFREAHCRAFLDDLERSGCERTHKGVQLDVYSLRHSFATMARRAGIASDVRDYLLGHRAKDTKSLHYEDEDILVVALAVAKLPALLPEDVVQQDDARHQEMAAGDLYRGPKTPLAAVPETAVLVRDLVPCTIHASGALSVSLMISAEEKRFELLDSLHRRRFSKPLP